MSFINKIAFFILICLIHISCSQNSNSDRSNHQKNAKTEEGMSLIPSGVLSMGGDNEQAASNEFPKHEVYVESFYMDLHEVTNKGFSTFVNETNYKTVAERDVIWEELAKQLPPGTPKPPDSLLVPGALVFTPTESLVNLNNPQQWWTWTTGANWRHPSGPKNDIINKGSHPVVQIAWDDANAYCKWAGKRLPTEAEWEWAARGGEKDMIYPWGNESINTGQTRANFYQGLFPYKNTKKDGFEGAAPVMSFDPNGYGLYDMSGNVWEWCSDWYDVTFYKTKDAKKKNTTGPAKGYNNLMPFQQEKVIRGGSFLCSDEYCSGYRNARRMGSTVDTGLNHTGCRCVKDN